MLFRWFIFPYLLDPTFTLPNLTALLENVDWDLIGRYYLDIPDATLDTIRSSGGDDSQCRRKCWKVYLNEHPAPSWKHVANALYRESYLYNKNRLKELEVVQKKYLKGERVVMIVTCVIILILSCIIMHEFLTLAQHVNNNSLIVITVIVKLHVLSILGPLSFNSLMASIL